jgi:hypothetical protein
VTEQNIKMKIITCILMTLCCTAFLKAGEISGQVRKMKNKQLIADRGEIFVGELGLNEEKMFINYPQYFLAMLNASKNRRIIDTNTKGKFLIKDIPTNKKLLIGISFSGIMYFIEAEILDSNTLEINEIIDLDVESVDLKIKVQNKTGIKFKTHFAKKTYLIPEASKGRIFSGKYRDTGVVTFGNVPVGAYKLYVINELEEDEPIRVDSVSVKVESKENTSPPVIEVK